MTDMLTHSPLAALTGGLGHLKLHAPVATACPFRTSMESQSKSFQAFNLAFQQATGWELELQETPSSYRQRVSSGNQHFPAISRASVVDLSPILPPGIPAVSRIYCEKLLEELNLFLADLGRCRQELFCLQSQDSQVSQDSPRTDSLTIGSSNSADSAAFTGKAIAELAGNPPLLSNNFALSPLQVDSGRAVCDWHIDGTGVVRFVVLCCEKSDENNTRELLAARATFQAECRHATSNLQTREVIIDSNNRFFPGRSNLKVAIGSLNPLTGDIRLVADTKFKIGRTTATDSIQLPGDAETECCTYLSADEHLCLSIWPQISYDDECDEIERWLTKSMAEIRHVEATEVIARFQERMEQSIPGLPMKPALAFAVSRR